MRKHSDCKQKQTNTSPSANEVTMKHTISTNRLRPKTFSLTVKSHLYLNLKATSVRIIVRQIVNPIASINVFNGYIVVTHGSKLHTLPIVNIDKNIMEPIASNSILISSSE